MSKEVTTIILAAGKGTRMKSNISKPMHKIAGLEIISHIIKTVEKIDTKETIIVVSEENNEDIINTFEIVKDLMLNGYINSMNASIFVPYPGTKLFEYCDEHNLITTKNWFDYDMRKNVMELDIEDEKIFKYIKYFYNLSFNPLYVLNKIKSIRDIYDIKYHIRSLKNVLSYYMKDNDAM